VDNGRTLCFDCHKKTDTYLSACPLLTALKIGKLTFNTIA